MRYVRCGVHGKPGGCKKSRESQTHYRNGKGAGEGEERHGSKESRFLQSLSDSTAASRRNTRRNSDRDLRQPG